MKWNEAAILLCGGFIKKDMRTKTRKIKPIKKRRRRKLKTTLLIFIEIFLVAAAVFAFMKWNTRIEVGNVETDLERLTAASMDHSAWIVDGKLQISGKPYENQDEIKDWKHLVQVAISDNHVIALDHTGTAYAAGINANSQCEINGLEDVRYIDTGLNCSVAVMANGTVQVFGVMEESWREKLSQEKDVLTIAVGENHVAVLHKDGTVTAYGDDENGQCDVRCWNKIKQIAVGREFTVGLNSKGRIEFAGKGSYDSNFAVAWEAMKYIEAGNSHVVGINEAGIAFAMGWNKQGECNVSEWPAVVSVSAGYDHTIGLTETGQKIAVGYNGNGQCDVN